MKMNPNEMVFDNIKRETTKALKKMFGNRIKQNFLIEIVELFDKKYGFEVVKHFQYIFKFDGETLLRGNPDSYLKYEIARNIVGIHRNNSIFLSDHERALLQDDQKYKDMLVDKVFEQIKLREYAGKFARNFQLIAGDEFFFFPIPYKLLALSVKANKLIAFNRNLMFYDIYSTIFNKAVSALMLLENNMFDSVYPICRMIIEIYLRILIFTKYPNTYEKYRTLAKMELQKGVEVQYPDEFEEMFLKRKITSEKSKVNYLHFGWIDDIPDFLQKNREKKYSIYTLFDYIKEHKLSGDVDTLKYLYDFCHTYVHGTTGNTGYPLAHYFQISKMLYLTLEHAYRMLCETLGECTLIDDVDILQSLFEDYTKLKKQIEQRSTEKFDEYYKTFMVL